MDKLCSLWNGSKHRLACLFSMKGGMESLVTASTTLAHGCAANIAIHLTKSLIALLLKSQYPTADSVMFEILADKIVTNVIETYKGVTDVPGTCQDFMQNTIIRSCYTSPNKFVKLIANEFYDDIAKKIKINVWDFIANNISNDMCYNLLEETPKLFEEIQGLENLNRSSSLVGAYIVLKNTIGTETLDNENKWKKIGYLIENINQTLAAESAQEYLDAKEIVKAMK